MDKPKNWKNLSPEDRAVWNQYVQDMGSSEGAHDSQEENFELLLNETKIREELPAVEEKIVKITPDKNHGIKKTISQTPDSFQLDKRTFEKLQKGKISIDAKIDLHGLNQVQAHESLVNFILKSYDQGLRCVLVITGKGKARKDENEWSSPSMGVLKERTPSWLSSKILQNAVLKYVTAQPKDGGGGALYVYLRRKR